MDIKDMLIQTTEKIIEILHLHDSQTTYDHLSNWLCAQNVSPEELNDAMHMAKLYKAYLDDSSDRNHSQERPNR